MPAIFTATARSDHAHPLRYITITDRHAFHHPSRLGNGLIEPHVALDRPNERSPFATRADLGEAQHSQKLIAVD